LNFRAALFALGVDALTNRGINMTSYAELTQVVRDFQLLVSGELANVPYSTKSGVYGKYILVLLAPDNFDPDLLGEYFAEFVNGKASSVGLSAQAAKLAPHGAFTACSQVNLAWAHKVSNFGLCVDAMAEIARAAPAATDARCLAAWITTGLISSPNRLNALFQDGISELRMLIVTGPSDLAAFDQRLRQSGIALRPLNLLGPVTAPDSLPMAQTFFNYLLRIG